MKFLILLSILFSHYTFACETPAKNRDLFALFHVGNQPTTWRSVKQSGFVKDKGFPITVFAKSSVKNSKVKLRRKSYTLEQVSFCLRGNGVTVTHPEHGDLKVTRYGRGEKAYIKLRRSALVNFTLRPIQYVLDKAPQE